MNHNFTLWHIIKIGGPVMYFLILCSIGSIGVMIERLFYYFKLSRTSRAEFMESIKQLLAQDDFKKAASICKNTVAPFAQVISVGLSNVHLEEKELSDALEREITLQTNELERWTSIVGTIGSTAVYIGLLGTVWGIIKTFEDIAQAGSSGINVVIGGISEALVCTAAGLCVAIPAVVAYNFFLRKIQERCHSRFWFLL